MSGSVQTPSPHRWGDDFGHTAVKVDGQYHGPVVWVKDASRSVPVVSQLLSEEQRGAISTGATAGLRRDPRPAAAKAGEWPLP
ncbi:MAG: hypothetical protein IPH03_13710 [Tetrasphaera sp.]|nr:hypothetical protein [Tetrasphaera sp.]